MDNYTFPAKSFLKSSSEESQIRIISQKMVEAARKGYCSIEVDFYIFDSVRKKLLEEKFVISTDSIFSTKIVWNY